MSLFFSGSPLNGDATDNFLLDFDLDGPDTAFFGGAGDDFLLGDITSFFVQGAAGTTMGTGSMLTSSPSVWSFDDNPDITAATTLPHATIYGLGIAGVTAWYQVSVTAGQTITLDIDYGDNAIGGVFDSVIQVFNSGGTVVAENDQSGVLDPGSTSTGDAFLQYTFAGTGTYFLQVGTYQGTGTPGNFAGGEEYLLNVSLTGQPVGGAERGGSDTMFGGAGDDVLYGMGGDDLLHGGAGRDTLRGGAGNDRLYIDLMGDLADIEVYDGGAGTDTLRLSHYYGVDYLFDLSNTSLTSIEVLSLADPGASRVAEVVLQAAQIGPGLAANATLRFAGFDDVVETLRIVMGGVSSLSLDAMTVTGFGGDDRIVISGAAAAETITGSRVTDQIFGGAGNDILSGGSAGDDELYGGDGNDTLLGGAGTDTLEGGTGNDLLHGGSGNDLLRGNAGTDTLNGSLGDDTMVGGTGNDIYFVDTAGDVVTELPGEGTDLVFSSANYALGANVENLTLLGTGNLNGTGNALSNLVVGNAGNNLLAGGAGNDTLNGGAGNDVLDGGTGNDLMFGRQGDDTYLVESAGDRAVESPGQGYDTVRASVSFTLSAQIEDLVLLGAVGLTGVGNNQDNRIIGTGAADSINGQGGADTLFGGTGNDSLVGGAGADRLFGGQGNDIYYVDATADQAIESPGQGYDLVLATATFTLGAEVEELRLLGGAQLSGFGNGGANRLIGNVANNTLAGGSGNDVLIGGDGADRLIGGAGDDQMFGGANPDIFVLQNGWGVDRVNDFVLAGGDRVDLSAVTAITSFADLTADHLSTAGGNAVIIDGANRLFLIGVAAGSLLADDFIF